MLVLLRSSLYALAIAALSIGVMVYGLGPHRTAGFFSSLLEMLGFGNGYSGDLNLSNVSSEMRFYSVFWFAFGCFTLTTARARALNTKHVWIILGLFFAGGIGRVIGLAQGDQPDGLFMALMWIELVGPLVLGAALLRLQRVQADP